MSHNHYFRDVTGLEKLDVYRLLDLFGVTCPVAQHVVKKAIAAGQRGHKTLRRDWQDIADSARRKMEMINEDNGWTDSAIKAAAFPSTGVFGPMTGEWPDESRRQDAAAEDEAFAAVEARQYTGQGGVMIQCPGCTASSCECRP